MSRSLYEEFLGPEPPRRLKGRQAAGLAVTFAIHALVILAAVSARFEVKFLQVRKKATPVYLAPPEKIELPADYEKRLASLPQLEEGQDAFWGYPARARRTERIEESSVASSGEPSASSTVSSSGGAAPAGSKSGFIINYRPGSERGAVPEFDLSLPAKSAVEAGRRARASASADPRLKSYPSTNISGGQPGEGYALARSATGDRVIYRGRLPAGAQSFELAAWGRLVVEAIQKYWILPVTKADLKAGKVGVTVVVEKDGTVSLIRIINSSNTALLDRSALAAITASLPFPPLPGGFPEPSLETYFLFDCHEK